MVDINKRKDNSSSSSSSSSSKKKKKKKKKSSGSSSSSGSSGGSDTEPFEMGDDAIPDVSDASVSDVSQEWATDGAELNTDVGASGSSKEYIKRQIQECEEFYDNFYETASDNMTDVNQFTLYFHAITLALARNRLGIRDVLTDRFDKSKPEAVEITNRICDKAGEAECMDKILTDLTERLDEE